MPRPVDRRQPNTTQWQYYGIPAERRPLPAACARATLCHPTGRPLAHSAGGPLTNNATSKVIICSSLSVCLSVSVPVARADRHLRSSVRRPLASLSSWPRLAHAARSRAPGRGAAGELKLQPPGGRASRAARRPPIALWRRSVASLLRHSSPSLRCASVSVSVSVSVCRVSGRPWPGPRRRLARCWARLAAAAPPASHQLSPVCPSEILKDTN